MNIRKFLGFFFLSLYAIGVCNADVVAFPDAQGWGRWAKGARAVSDPTVYHVTNLNDSGTGSFRDAVSKANRIVVFDVSGVINISSRITFAKNLYIAGQTAPGEGVTIYGNGVSFSGADNMICRYLRVRMGHGGDDGKDCAGIANGTNMIFDHCSFSWGLDETFSINPDGKGDLGNITIQNTIIGQGLMTHSAGGLIQADNITLYRNLYVDNSTRNNKVKGISQYCNNVVYNWKNGCYIMGGDSQGKSYVNIESNLFINGPAGGGNAFTEANSDFNCYGNDNWQDSNCDGQLNPAVVTNYSAATRVSTPYAYPELPLWAGNELIEKLLPAVGASLPYRDQADCYMVNEVRSFGTEGALITYESSLPIGIPSAWTWWKGTNPTDTDGDGMPDAWESANGTDPAKDDATALAANGYLNIENYINGLNADNRAFFLRRPVTLGVKTVTNSQLTLEWRDYTEQEEGFLVEMMVQNVWKEVARTSANATFVALNDLESDTEYKVRVRAFAQQDGAEVYSEAVSLTAETLPDPFEIIDVAAYQPDVTNETTVEPGQELLFEAFTGETLTFSFPQEITPASVVAKGGGTVELTGAAIGGRGTSVNRDDEGVLILNNKNTYTGVTVTHGGTIKFNTIANGKVACSLGAAKAVAQYWVLDGGTFCYTGSSASTDRSARIDRDGTLAIEKASTTLTMTGKMEGEGSLTLDGKGTLSIANANFFAYQGATHLKGGKIYLSDTENACKAFGAMTKPLVLEGGCLQFAYKNEDFQTLSFPVEVVEGTTSILSMPSHCYFRSKVTGNGTLQFDIPYLRSYLKPDLTGFNGRVIANATKSGALFYHENQWNTPHLCYDLKNGISMSSWASNAVNELGGLSGDAGTSLLGTSKQNTGFTCSWVVGSANTDETFRGVINNLPAGGNSAYSGTTSITKTGTGIWRLKGNNVYSGVTNVKQGTLIINGNHTGTGTTNVFDGATLKGKGSIAGKVALLKGATLCPGDGAIDESDLTVKGGATFNASSTIIIPVAMDAQKNLLLNALSIAGTVTIGSGAVLELDLTQAAGYQFKSGDCLPVFRNAIIKSPTGSFAISPASPGEGLEWETSTLLIDGMLRVKNEGEIYQGGVIVTEEKQATLEHSASVQGGSNAAGTFLDAETHYYNCWGTTSWVAQAYAQFKLDLKEGEEILKAEYTIVVNCAGKKDGRALDVCYMPAGTARITSQSTIPALTASVGTQVATYTDIKRSYATKTMDVTDAVKAMAKAGQDYILFIHSNGAAGGYIYGKGSSANMPKLKLTTKYLNPNSNPNLNLNANPNAIYDLWGNKVTKMQGGQVYLMNGKKIVKY